VTVYSAGDCNRDKTMLGLNGTIPVLRKADFIVDSLNVCCRISSIAKRNSTLFNLVWRLASSWLEEYSPPPLEEAHAAQEGLVCLNDPNIDILLSP
jgi:hypothetical protein